MGRIDCDANQRVLLEQLIREWSSDARWPGFAHLAARTGLSLSTVKRHYRALDRLGITTELLYTPIGGIPPRAFHRLQELRGWRAAEGGPTGNPAVGMPAEGPPNSSQDAQEGRAGVSGPDGCPAVGLEAQEAAQASQDGNPTPAAHVPGESVPAPAEGPQEGRQGSESAEAPAGGAWWEVLE